jgi:hypothetical protein
LVDDLYPLRVAIYGIGGAGADTGIAGALASLREDIIGGELATGKGGTALVDDMGFIFIAEVTDGGEDGIWRCLAQAAEGARLNILS